MSEQLKIEAVENGFVVTVISDSCNYKTYAFEEAVTMASMVGAWGWDVTKASCDKKIKDE